MKKLDFGQTFQLLGNLGVVVGILLLVYELSQNRQMMEAQTRNDLYDGLFSFLDHRSDPELLELLIRRNNDEELSQLESARLTSMLNIHFRYMENLHYQYRNGLFDETEFSAQRTIWQQLFSSRAYGEYWCEVRNVYAPELGAEVNGLLSTYRCD